jgi:hypothetical protein
LEDNTLFQWILLIVTVIITLRFIYLIIKRLILIHKISKQAKKYNGDILYSRSPLISIFKHDGKTDLSISLSDRTIELVILTTPMRYVRYHFDVNNKSLELIVERRAMYVVNHKVPNGFSSMDRVYTIWKYNIDFEPSEGGKEKYIILNPAPRSVSKAEGAVLEVLGNNDTLVKGVKVCGLRWFIENIV